MTLIILGITVYALLGLRYAWRFLHASSGYGVLTAGEWLDWAIVTPFIVAIWPLMIIAKLLREG